MTGGMPSGCRSRSSCPLTGRTAARSGAGTPVIALVQHPAATTTWSEAMPAPPASPTPAVLPSRNSTSVTRSRTTRTPAAAAAARRAAAYRRLSTDQSPANSTPPCTSGVRNDSSLRQARLSSSSASSPADRRNAVSRTSAA